MVKVRDGQVRNRPFYAAIGVDERLQGRVWAVWAGDGDGESARSTGWLQAVLTELRNRGVQDVFFVVCDGLEAGLPDSVNAVFAQATVQTCIIHLIREHLPVCLPQVPGRVGQGHAPDLHRPDRGRGQGPVR